MKIRNSVFLLIFLTGIAHSNEPASSAIVKSPSLDPNQVIERLFKGNERFAEEVSVHPHYDMETRVKTARDGQKPLASIISCSDSRVPPEAIFDVGVGDLFVVRVAGNIADRSEIGSLEYGAGHLGTPLIIVIGHTRCGAVTAVVKRSNVEGNILSLVDNIKPAVALVQAQFKTISEEDLIDKSIKANVWQSIEDILKHSAEIRSLIKEGKLKVIGAFYDIETGKITNAGVHFRQEQIIRAAGK